MATIIDGKAVSAFLKDGIKKECLELKEKGVSVCLAVIIVGDDPASRTYVNNKKKACEAVGIISREYALPADTCLLYTSPSPRDRQKSRMPSSA